MQFLLMIYASEAGWNAATPAEQEQGLAAYTAYTQALKKAGVLAGSNRLRRRRVRNHRAHAEREVPGPERALRRDQGAARRLLPDRRARPRHRHLLGGALPRRQPRHCRSASDLADGRLGAPLVTVTTREGDDLARSTADAVARRSYSKLVAFLAARTGDVAAAEDALSEAFASALADWPVKGCPANPEAWLLTAARRKVIDTARRDRRGDAAAGEVRLLAEGLEMAAAAPEIPDHRLALMFACAHPAIEIGIRAPLMLQVVLGSGRRDDRLGVSHVTAGDGPAPGARQDQDSPGGDSFRNPRSRAARRSGSTPSWMRSIPPSRRDGPTPAAPTSHDAISPRRRSGWAAW